MKKSISKYTNAFPKIVRYILRTIPKHFLPFDYSIGTCDEITVYADVYPDWSITVGKQSNKDKDLFDELMDTQGLVKGIRYLLFRGEE